MSYVTVECIQPVCDGCGAVLEGDYEVHFQPDEIERGHLDAWLDDCGWTKADDGRLFCLGCPPPEAAEEEK